MKLIGRQIRIIKCINENPQAGLKDIGEMLGISLATVKSDLEFMAGIMREYHVRLEILAGNQLRLWGRENLNYMLKDFQTMQAFSLEKQIMLILLLEENFTVIQDIADKLFVSKSLVEKVISLMLKKYPEVIEGVRRHGIRAIIPQLERRTMFAEILSPYVTGIDFFSELKTFNVNHFPLLDFITADEIAAAEQAIGALKSVTEFSFTDESTSELFLQMIFALSVTRRWEHVSLGTIAGEMITGIPGESSYRHAGQALCQAAGLTNDGEKDYFSCLLMGLRKQRISDTSEYESAMREVIYEILEKIYSRLAVELRGDRTLFQGLAVHLYTTVVRKSRLAANYHEDDSYQIRREYPLGFEMAAIAAGVIQERYSYRVSDEEMMYLAMHFQASVERMRAFGQKLRVLVVCHYGMAAASLISARVERYFPAVQIIGTISVQSFFDMKEVQADLILSTENIETKGTPVIYVTPMLPEEDLRQIRQFVDTHGITNLLMMQVLNAKIIDSDKLTREDVLAEAISVLEAGNFVSHSYRSSVFSREEVSPTDLDNIAVPHGNPDDVLETQLVVVRLKQPIFWQYSNVQYVFLFAVARKEMQRNFTIFSAFYKRLVRTNIRAELKKLAKEPADIFRTELAHLLSV